MSDLEALISYCTDDREYDEFVSNGDFQALPEVTNNPVRLRRWSELEQRLTACGQHSQAKGGEGQLSDAELREFASLCDGCILGAAIRVDMANGALLKAGINFDFTPEFISIDIFKDAKLRPKMTSDLLVRFEFERMTATYGDSFTVAMAYQSVTTYRTDDR